MRSNSALDSRLLEVFLAVCQTGGMTAAARSLGITQGAVSQQIGRLEGILDLKLIERENREFRVLPAGITLQHHAKRVLDELHQTERAMQRFAGFSFPNVSVRIMDSLGKTLTDTVVETLQGVVEQMQITTAIPQRRGDEIAHGKLDMVISSSEFDPDAFEIHPIAVEPLVLLIPKALLAANHLELDELANILPFVHYASQRYLSLLTDRYLARQMVSLVRTIEVDQSTAVIDTVRNGQGWAITSPFTLLDPAFNPAEIDVRALPQPVPTRMVNLVSRRDIFFDLPKRLAANCREHLRREVISRLHNVVPRPCYPVIADQH
jgi:DNA-binding transcriptional LysR family regulator